MSVSSRNSDHHWKCQVEKNLSDKNCHNILEHDNVLIHTQLTKSKTKRDIQYSKRGIRVASQVAKRLKT